MKKQLLLSTLCLLFTAGIMAQDVQKAPNARTKEALLKLQTEIGLSNDQSAKAYPILERYFTAQQQLNDELKTENPDVKRIETDMKKLNDQRNYNLKVILTAEQAKKLNDGKRAIVFN